VRFAVMASSWLEVDLGSDLHLARNVISVDLSKGGAIDVCLNRVGAAVVERVERLEAKLQAGTLAEF
jgi:hypothetical protein